MGWVGGWGITVNIDQYTYDRIRPKWPTETNVSSGMNEIPKQ
jgi:hypothetical protein